MKMRTKKMIVAQMANVILKYIKHLALIQNAQRKTKYLNCI